MQSRAYEQLILSSINIRSFLYLFPLNSTIFSDTSFDHSEFIEVDTSRVSECISI